MNQINTVDYWWMVGFTQLSFYHFINQYFCQNLLAFISFNEWLYNSNKLVIVIRINMTEKTWYFYSHFNSGNETLPPESSYSTSSHCMPPSIIPASRLSLRCGAASGLPQERVKGPRGGAPSFPHLRGTDSQC